MLRVLGFIISLAGIVISAEIVVIERAHAQSDPFDVGTIREANELIRNKSYNEAVAKLAPLVPHLAGKPEFDTVYGLSLLESGRPLDAAVAFRRALAIDPNNLFARGQLGRALAASGDLDDARREMSVVLDRPDLSPDLKATMERNIALLDEAKKKKEERVGPSLTPSDAEIVKSAAKLVRAKKASRALAILEPLIGRLVGNSEFDYVYGVASLDAGRPAQAATSLRRALEENPNLTIARAELARALAAMGDLAGAKRELETVRGADGLPSNVRNVIGQQITAIDHGSLTPASGISPRVQVPPQKSSATRISGFIEASFGYDTNVNGGPTSDTLLIPAFNFLGPATLSPSSLPKKADFYELGGGISIVHAFSEDLAVFANGIGNWHMLLQNQEFRTSLAGGEAGIARQLPGLGTFSVAAVGQTFNIGDDTYRNAYGLAGQWRSKIADWEPSIAFTWLRLTYPQISMQDADRYTGTFALARQFELPLKPVISVSGYYGKENTLDPADDFLSYNFRGVRAGLELSLATWLTTFMQAGYEVHRYDTDFPLFFYPRRDQVRELSAGFDVKLAGNLSFRPTVRYYETASNVDLFDNKRWITQGTLRWTY